MDNDMTMWLVIAIATVLLPLGAMAAFLSWLAAI